MSESGDLHEPRDAEPLRIGVLGASRIAPGALIAPARALGHRVVAVAARDPERAQAYASEHGIERVAASYAGLVADPEIDVVYNGLPNGLHGPWALACIAAGKHALVEKPFASNADEAVAVADAARTSGLVVTEAFHYWYHPLLSRTLALVADGTVGAVREVHIDMVMPPPQPADPRWSFDLAGGSLMDVGCYALHLARTLGPALGGAPDVLTATAVERPAGIDERVDVGLRYPDGTVAHVRSGMDASHVRFAFRIVGTNGAIEAPQFVAPHQDDRLVVTSGSETRTEHTGTRPTHEWQLDAFAGAVRGDETAVLDLDDAIAQARLIDAVYAAAGLPPRPAMSITD